MSNQDIRIAMIQANTKQYEVARHLGISEGHFSKQLRYELSKEYKTKVLQAIEELKNQ